MNNKVQHLRIEPRLRFENFIDSYSKKMFNSLFNFSTGKNIKQAEASPDFETPCVRYGELYHMYSEVITSIINKTNLPIEELKFSDGNEILLPSAGEDSLDIGSASALTIPNVAIGRTINILTPKSANTYEPIYVSYYINTKLKNRIAKLAKGVSISNVYNTDLQRLYINLPSLKEQKKIVATFVNLDKKITLLENKISNLKLFKKGLTQKLFPNNNDTKPKLRVKGYAGDWKLVKVGDLLTERNDKSTKSETYPLMAFIAYIGVAEKGDRFDREFLINNEDDKKYKRTEYGDFIYSSNNLTTGSIGLNKYGKATISPVYSIFSPTNKTNSEFINNILIRDYFINQMIRYRQGVVYGQWRIHEKDFLNIDIRIPELDEQNEILKLINSLVEKIIGQQRNLENLKQFKRGLLQQMFI